MTNNARQGAAVALGGPIHDAGISAQGEAEKNASNRAVRFVVPGAAVGKGRPRISTRGGFARAYTPEKTVAFEKTVAAAAREAMAGSPLFAGSVAVELFLFVEPPKSWSLKKQRAALAGELLPTSKPDLDNCLKAIMDAMNEVVFDDDKQVVDCLVRKRYGPRSETFVVVSEVAA